jgi:translation elongation factor EF-Ts
MANITAVDVKRLREATGAGMMDCKTALESSEGDFAKAVEYLRVKGQAGISKRQDRTTSNGLVTAHVEDGVGILLEINCETDFVARRGLPGAQRASSQAQPAPPRDMQTLLAVEAEPGKDRAGRSTGAATIREAPGAPAGADRGPRGHVVPAPHQPRPAAADRRAAGHRRCG